DGSAARRILRRPCREAARSPRQGSAARSAGRVPSRRLLRLQRYLLGELLTAFLLVTLIVTGMIVTAFLLQTLQKYPELSMLGVLQLVPVLVGVALPLSLPMSFLMACLLS